MINEYLPRTKLCFSDLPALNRIVAMPNPLGGTYVAHERLSYIKVNIKQRLTKLAERENATSNC